QRGAEVRRDQDLLELTVQGLVDRAVRLEDRGELGAEEIARALQPRAQPLPEAGEERHGPGGGRTRLPMTTPRPPSGGSFWPFSSRLTPPALPTVSTKGRLEIHSR